MEELLNKLLEGQNEIFQNIKTLNNKMDSLEVGQKELFQSMNKLELKVNDLELGQEDIKATVNRIETRQGVIFEQTAGLTEFRTEVVTALKEIREHQRSVNEVLGEHEVQIRTIRRHSV